jgi:hypothetical protein
VEVSKGFSSLKLKLKLTKRIEHARRAGARAAAVMCEHLRALGDAELMRLRQRYFAIDPGASAFGCAASQRPGCETCHLTSGDDAMVCLQCGARRHLLLRLVLHARLRV